MSVFRDSVSSVTYTILDILLDGMLAKIVTETLKSHWDTPEGRAVKELAELKTMLETKK